MPYNPFPTPYQPPAPAAPAPYDPNQTIGGYYPQPEPNYPYNIPPRWRPPIHQPSAGPGITPNYPPGTNYGPSPGFANPPAAPGYPGAPAPAEAPYYRGGGGGSFTGGMSEELRAAYKDFWGSDPSDKYKQIHQSVSQMFANYFNRPARLGDWNRLWTANKLAYTRAGETEDIDQAYTDPALFDPLVAHFAPGPKVEPPTTAYQPEASF